eukprot:13810707-Alexandrium_andersonii.AAC.1
MGAGALAPCALAAPAPLGAQLEGARCELWPNAHAAVVAIGGQWDGVSGMLAIFNLDQWEVTLHRGDLVAAAAVCCAGPASGGGGAPSHAHILVDED